MTALPRSPSDSPSDMDECVDGLHRALAEAKSAIDLDQLMRSFHLVKGYAQPLGLLGVQRMAHELEGRVAGLIQIDSEPLSTSELQILFSDGIARLNAVLTRFHEMQIRAIAQGIRKNSAPPSLFRRLENAGRSLAVELGVDVRFKFTEIDRELSSSMSEALYAAFLHAIRNSLAHGIVPGQSLEIRMSARVEKGWLTLECADSGRGIDPRHVRETARDRRIRFNAELERMDDDEVLQLLFRPGFSLSAVPTLLAGRGYGLDIAREAVEDKLCGRLRIQSELGKGTRLIARVPISA